VSVFHHRWHCVNVLTGLYVHAHILDLMEGIIIGLSRLANAKTPFRRWFRLPAPVTCDYRSIVIVLLFTESLTRVPYFHLFIFTLSLLRAFHRDSFLPSPLSAYPLCHLCLLRCYRRTTRPSPALKASAQGKSPETSGNVAVAGREETSLTVVTTRAVLERRPRG
jgi:hypothetical protein